ncbi:hypothetical protein L6164_011028 [Bauhinia variegata]|uniref:Uncharacterized protein n=1 Tax=Bauhinia variegata TaxID=167791 RepID=A0ACB9P8G0_BAUVA|nr:hypothetical protein L6164_011028 [Bauhinia variegata]
MESDDSFSRVIPAREYYSRSTWWSESVKGNGGSHGNGDEVNTLEIRTPDISRSQDELSSSRKWVNGIYVGDTDEDVNDDELDRYSRRVLSTEIVEIFEDGKSITDIQDRRDDDIYVAVGKDDMDVVNWVLEHAASSRTRIFLIHVSPPITLIPTPVGMLQRSQLTPQQVRRYVNAENFKRKQLMLEYIQMSEHAKVVTAETILLESKDTCKAILDLILVLNITNLVIGTKKPPHSGRLKKTLTKGEFVKKNAPKSCCVTLIYDGNEVMNTRYINILASSGGQSKSSFFLCSVYKESQGVASHPQISCLGRPLGNQTSQRRSPFSTMLLLHLVIRVMMEIFGNKDWIVP